MDVEGILSAEIAEHGGMARARGSLHFRGI